MLKLSSWRLLALLPWWAGSFPAQADDYQALPQVPINNKNFVPAKPFDLHDANYVVSDGTNYCVINKLCFLALGSIKQALSAGQPTHLTEVQVPWPGAIYKNANEFLQINSRAGLLILIKGNSPDPHEPEVDVHEGEVKEALKEGKPVVAIDETGMPAGLVKVLKDQKDDQTSPAENPAPNGDNSPAGDTAGSAPAAATSPAPDTTAPTPGTGDNQTNQSVHGGTTPTPTQIPATTHDIDH